MGNWKKICCAVDFSDPSRLALYQAADLAKRDGAELMLVHAYEVPRPSGDLMVAAVDLTGPAAAEAEKSMIGWVAEAARLRGAPVKTRIVAGEAAAEVTKAAAQAGCDLLVVGTHGRTGVKRLVLGSVAERIVREAHCDVLVARGP